MNLHFPDHALHQATTASSLEALEKLFSVPGLSYLNYKTGLLKEFTNSYKALSMFGTSKGCCNFFSNIYSAVEQFC